MRVHRVGFVVSVLVMLAGIPVAASAHDATAEHMREDAVPPKTAAQERAMTRATMVASRPGARAAAAKVTGTEGTVGSWTAPVNWPVVGVHVALLPNGKVLAYDSIGDHATESYPVQDHSRATVWDPATGTQTDVTVATGFNVFCSGLAHLPDGSIFLAGGNKDQQLNGINKTHIFNPQTLTWTLGPDMTYARWYPSVTAMKNGEMLITEGGPDIPEVRQTNGSLRTLTSASLNLPLYPWLNVGPDGKTFYSGPDTTMRKLDTAGTGTWTTAGNRGDSINRDYGSHAMYDIGKILVAGGGSSSRTARVININGATPVVTATNSMVNGRRQHNLTVLADGAVLATGGNKTGASLIDMNGGVFVGELWNPATGAWTTMAAQAITRQYHSTALLLPDGRVLSSGGGICGTCDQVNYLAKNAEVFTPPYLYKKDGSGQLAPRPTITSAPPIVDYATQMQIETPDAASISKVALIRLGAVTHSNDMDQRYVPLTYTKGTGTLTATAPANASIAPPGPYMVVVVDSAGVPSVAKMVSIPVSNSPPSVNITAPASGATYNAPATVDIAANASDTDGTIGKVEFFSGATKVGEDTTAPYELTWNSVPQGTYSISARATDNANRATNSAAVSITVNPASADSTPPSVSLTAPAQGATVSGAVSVTADASDNVGVTNVQFKLDGANLGAADTTSPYAVTWDSTTATPGSHTLTAVAKDAANNSTTSTAVTVTVPDATPPSVSVTAPAQGATVSGTVNVSATASDNAAVSSVQFKLDGQNLGSADTTSPYAVTWDTSTATPGSHTLTAVATDAANNSATSSAVTVTVSTSGPAGLVAAYGFEETSGTTATDSSGTGNAGTITGATRTSAGRNGSALSFNGTSDWVTIPGSSSLALTTAFTLEAWVKSNGPGSVDQTVLTKEKPPYMSYQLYAMSSGGSLASTWRDTNGSYGSDDGFFAPSSSPTPTATWTHLAATYDNTTLRLFMNGTQIASKATTGAITNTTAPLRIGGNSVWGEYFSGLIDDVRVYNRALTTTELNTDMNQATRIARNTSLRAPSSSALQTPLMTWCTPLIASCTAYDRVGDKAPRPRRHRRRDR
ncbi:MAG: hypothetical protein QOG15_1828 [Solirubrobacteraceae bacterium]|nr:hypothetical protein [Solirubrobacteraceae bacterium]